MEGNITITKEEYFELCCDREILERLHQGGVDNWDWYEDSISPDDDDYAVWENEEYKRVKNL